jgi:hypothetical protein
MPRRLSAFAWLILLGAFYLGFASGTGRLWDYDFWWHLKTGELIVRQGAIPHADPFSWTRPGAPWNAHEWGWEALLYLVYSAGGWLGLIYLKAILFGVCALLAAYLALRWGAGLLPALAVTALMAVAVSIWLNARPQMLIVLYVLLLLHLLTSYREGRPRALWWLPVIFLFWANTHGSFLIGWGLLALFGVCEALQPSPRGAGLRLAMPPAGEGGVQAPALESTGETPVPPDLRLAWPRPRLRALAPLLLPGIASVLICLANPHLLEGALYPFSYLVGENAYHAKVITEYASPDFHEPIFVVLEALLLLTVVAMILSPVGPSLWELTLLLVGTYLFLKWARNGPLLAVFCVPLAARHLSARARRSPAWRWLGDQEGAAQQPRPALLGIAVAVLLLALVLIAPRDPSPAGTIAGNLLPVGATEFIQAKSLPGHMFNTYEWGGYLIWRLAPEYRVYIDGRADMYGTPMLQEYEKIVKLKPGWREALRQRQIQWLLLRAEAPLAVVLEGEGDYTVVYQDETAVLLVRRGRGNERLLETAVGARRAPSAPADEAGP